MKFSQFSLSYLHNQELNIRSRLKRTLLTYKFVNKILSFNHSNKNRMIIPRCVFCYLLLNFPLVLGEMGESSNEKKATKLLYCVKRS